MISVQAWSAEAKLQGPHPLVQAGPHPCPTPHREDLKGSEEEQDAEGSGEVAWLWIFHGSKVPSRQQQVFSGVTAAKAVHLTPLPPAFIFSQNLGRIRHCGPSWATRKWHRMWMVFLPRGRSVDLNISRGTGVGRSFCPLVLDPQRL